MYLNQDADFLASLNQIGVQSVYYGGMDIPNGMKGETADNESDIVWYFIKDYTTPAMRTISGTVFNEDNQPLAGVTVTAEAVADEPTGLLREPTEGLTTVTGDDGTYTIEVPADATYNLTFEKEGYKIQTVAEENAETIIMVLDIPTGVVGVKGVVESVIYVNAAGLKSDKPFEGVNIVIKRMSDGSVSTTKMVK